MRKRHLIMATGLIILSGAASYWLTHQPLPTLTTVQRPTIVKKLPPVTTPTPTTFNKSQFSLTDPASIWTVVNKKRPLEPKTYVPADLVTPNVPLRTAGMQVRQAMASALESMFSAAATNGTPMRVASAYRSYNYQVNLYNGYVKSQGQSVADSQSARPGFSEHQTGLAADVSPLAGNCSVTQCFATTPAGQWLAANAYKYGFIIRYGDGLTSTTGYEYEPWHIRYIGIELATEMHNKSVPTLEQFFELGAVADY